MRSCVGPVSVRSCHPRKVATTCVLHMCFSSEKERFQGLLAPAPLSDIGLHGAEMAIVKLVFDRLGTGPGSGHLVVAGTAAEPRVIDAAGAEVLPAELGTVLRLAAVTTVEVTSGRPALGQTLRVVVAHQGGGTSESVVGLGEIVGKTETTAALAGAVVVGEVLLLHAVTTEEFFVEALHKLRLLWLIRLGHHGLKEVELGVLGLPCPHESFR